MTEPLFALPPPPEPEPIELFVHGLPAPQGSHRAILDRRGHPQITDGGTPKTRREHRQWRKAVTAAARAWREAQPEWEPLDEPLSLRVMFVLPLPETDPYRTRHAVSPDTDKLVRSVFDSLTDSGVIVDDSRFFAIHASALYARPGEAVGARLRITRFGAAERADRERLKEEARAARRRHH